MPIHFRVGSEEEIARFAADQVEETIKRANTRRIAGLGSATGGTPVPLYAETVRRVKRGQLSFKKTRCFGLDEYLGLPLEHPQSYHTFMLEHLWEPAGVPEKWRHLPDAANPAAYDQLLRESDGGAVDLQILGIGSGGHIGFNEKGSPFDSQTRIVQLHESTLRDNARYFDGDPNKTPKEAVTMGIATILTAGKVVLIATGEVKAGAVRDAFERPPSVDCPASALQSHRDVLVLLDPAAASLLTKSPICRIAA